MASSVTGPSGEHDSRTPNMAAGLQTWRLRDRELLPIIQGGMGIGISAGGLAGAVARAGAMGTISSVDLRRLHPDLMARTENIEKEPDARDQIDAANLEALDREVSRALVLSGGKGLVAVNVMKAVTAYPAYVRQSLQSGAQAIAVGAGLPLDLPELAKDHPHVALIPILSDARGVQLLIRKWERRGRLPDAIVIEHPGRAGGHLGAARVADLNDPRFEFDVVIPAVLEFLQSQGLAGAIPLVAAGGIHCHEDIGHLQGLGVAAVQLGSAFAVTHECDAHPNFKRVLASARAEDLVEFTSVAGLPARAVRTPWLDKYLRIEDKLKERAHVKRRCNMGFDCLAQCGLRDGIASIGQFCIDQQLGHAWMGDVQKGLFFRGAGPLPFGEYIATVQELIQWLMEGIRPANLEWRSAA